MKFLRLLLVPFALLIVAFVRLVYPWWKIRFGVLMSDRIGHLSGNTEVYMCERDHGFYKGFTDIFVPGRAVANHYFLKMLSRSMNIDRSRFTLLLILVNKLFRGWERHDVTTQTYDRDPLNLLEKTPPHLHFTAREEAKGEDERRKLGIPDGVRWVCLIVRDSAYLPDLKYHNFRDSDIDTYELAVLELVERGYYVVRMGSKVAKPMTLKHPKVIDYATNGMRSEFMDIYLGANCEFVVSSGTGWDSIPEVFRRPVCFVNYAPLEYLRTYMPKSLAIYKHHVKDGKRLTPSEIFKAGVGAVLHAPVFDEAGVSLIDNTPEEIRDLVVEMEYRLERSRKLSERGLADVEVGHADTIQNRFWSEFPRNLDRYTGKPLHGEIRMRIGSKFLQSYEPASVDRAA